VQIFDDAARELASVADAVRRALEFEPDEEIPFSYSGGVFNVGALILIPLERHLAHNCATCRLRAPMLAPSLGAAIHAARLAGKPLSATAIKRLAGALPRKEQVRSE
jgi:hypothetical protein